MKSLTGGWITVAFEGYTCPMAEVIKLVLKKLVLKEKEINVKGSGSCAISCASP